MIIRPRQAADLPSLVELLEEQQPTSGYPFRWPPPMPVADFVARPSDEASWVAVDDDGILGHVAVGAFSLGADTPFVEHLGGRTFRALTTLFTGLAARGRGVGAALHDHAVAHIRSAGHVPVLDVVATQRSALELYERRGWRTIATVQLPTLPPPAPAARFMVLDTDPT